MLFTINEHRSFAILELFHHPALYAAGTIKKYIITISIYLINCRFLSKITEFNVSGCNDKSHIGSFIVSATDYNQQLIRPLY